MWCEFYGGPMLPRDTNKIKFVHKRDFPPSKSNAEINFFVLSFPAGRCSLPLFLICNNKVIIMVNDICRAI